MNRKLYIAFIVAFTLLVGIFTFNLLRVHKAMKYLSVQYQVTKLQQKYNSTYHVLKGCYAFRVGNRNLTDAVTFKFSISGHLVTSVETAAIDQQYWPEKNAPVNEWKEGYLSKVFCVKDEDDVMIDLDLSMPKNKILYSRVFEKKFHPKYALPTLLAFILLMQTTSIARHLSSREQ